MNCTITHADTCLSDYAQRSHDIAIAVDDSTTVGALIDEIGASDPLGCEDWTDEQRAAFDAAVAELRAFNADKLEVAFDPSLEPFDEHYDSVYAYFDVEFDD